MVAIQFELSKMEVFQYSGIGQRAVNQDCILCKELPNNLGNLFIVCDGMGGYDGGDIAARISCEEIYAQLSLGRSIDESIASANERINEQMQIVGTDKMGCTVAACLIRNNEIHIFWCGDSRVYIIRDGKVDFVTKDHSMLEEIKTIRPLTLSDITRYSHIITRSLMGNVTDIVDKIVLPLQGDMRIMICSDGFHKELDDDIIATIDVEEVVKDNEMFDDNYSVVNITT